MEDQIFPQPRWAVELYKRVVVPFLRNLCYGRCHSPAATVLDQRQSLPLNVLSGVADSVPDCVADSYDALSDCLPHLWGHPAVWVGNFIRIVDQGTADFQLLGALALGGLWKIVKHLTIFRGTRGPTRTQLGIQQREGERLLAGGEIPPLCVLGPYVGPGINISAEEPVRGLDTGNFACGLD